MTASSASTELRTAIIARLKADAGVQATAMGTKPRVFNIAPPASDPRAVYPLLIVQDRITPFDTDTGRGAEHALQIFALGECMGHDEGEAIFQAVRVCLRDWGPVALSTHRLVNIIFQSQGIASEDDAKRYFGRQLWRAVTQETS